MKETLGEEIKFITEIFKLIFVLFFATTTGVISLFQKIDKQPIELLSFVLGCAISLGLIGGMVLLGVKIYSKIKKLKLCP